MLREAIASQAVRYAREYPHAGQIILGVALLGVIVLSSTLMLMTVGYHARFRYASSTRLGDSDKKVTRNLPEAYETRAPRTIAAGIARHD